jgi:hypothetical protein
MIVEMILMSQLTCVARKIAQPDGEDALANQITDAFQNGCFVMVKMIVVITAMSCQKIVQRARPIPISSVKITDAFRNNGHAILLMIVATDQMKRKLFAKENIATVPSQNLDAITESAFQVDGDAVRLH